MSLSMDAILKNAKENLDEAKKLQKDHAGAKTPEDKAKHMKLASTLKKDLESQKKEIEQLQKQIEVESQLLNAHHDSAMSILKNMAP